VKQQDQKKRKRPAWGDHVLRGRRCRTTARPMKLAAMALAISSCSAPQAPCNGVNDPRFSCRAVPDRQPNTVLADGTSVQRRISRKK
jgi:hypothetical protein